MDTPRLLVHDEEPPGVMDTPRLLVHDEEPPGVRGVLPCRNVSVHRTCRLLSTDQTLCETAPVWLSKAVGLIEKNRKIAFRNERNVQIARVVEAE